MTRKTDRLAITRLGKYLILLQCFWGLVVIASCFRNLHFEKTDLIQHATTEARTACDKDLLYRRWSAIHGGVYVAVDPATPPNPYLKVKERDITTPSGRRLTLVNPAYMTRQVHELGRMKSGIQGHITSLKPLNPTNQPDPWEGKALERIEKKGLKEVVELVENGRPRLRYMRRLLTEKGCLKCHAAQGYKEGSVRGGISVTIPLTTHFALLHKAYTTVITGHLALWLLGVLGIFFGGRRLRRQIERQREDEITAEKEWNAAMDASEDIIYLLNLDRRIIRANQSLARMSGMAQEELLGRHIADVVHPEGEKVPCPVCQAQEEKRDFHLVMEADHPDNPAPFPIEITLRVVRDEEGKPLSMLMNLHNLADSRQEIEKRQKLEADLQQARKMEAIGTLAGGIAHDFNNILTAIIGYTEMAQISLKDGRDIANDLDEVKKAGYRARDLVRQILTFSRHSEHSRQPLELQPLIKDALKLLRASIPTTIEINSDIAPDCGPVLADPSEVHQIIMNLGTNAYHAMRESGGELTVTLAETDIKSAKSEKNAPLRQGRYAKLTITDTGCGIAPELLEKIFEPYFTTKGQGEGTGLGLAVTQGIVRRCGGEILVESTPGKGTTFTVHLPVCDDEADQPNKEKEEETAAGNGEMILVVDDDPAIVSLETQLLESLAYLVTSFSDSEAALAAFREDREKFALVLSDMTMPKMTGKELARELLAIRPDIPILIATGYSDQINPAEAKELGISALLNKLLSRAALAAQVRRALGRS